MRSRNDIEESLNRLERLQSFGITATVEVVNIEVQLDIRDLLIEMLKVMKP